MRCAVRRILSERSRRSPGNARTRSSSSRKLLTLTHRCRVLDFAARHRLPAMYEFGVFARDGGFMAYGPKLTETFQRGVYYVDSILKGKKPAELPVEYPRQLELVINPQTAKTLGLSVPTTILTQADAGVRQNRCM